MNKDLDLIRYVFLQGCLELVPDWSNLQEISRRNNGESRYGSQLLMMYLVYLMASIESLSY